MSTKPNYPIGSVDSALRLLLMLREEHQIRVTDAARDLGVAPSTAHRLFAMLVAHGLVLQNPKTKVYSAGPALLALGLSAVRGDDLRNRMHPYLEKLVKEVDETVQLIILTEASSFFLDSCESEQAVKTTSRMGVSLPAHATSGGKALLAELTTEELHDLYPEEELEVLGPRTIATRSDLEVELEEIRKRGYALNIGETYEEVGAIAATVRNPLDSSHCPCAFAISAPLSRINRRSLKAMSGPLRAICDEASLGG